MASCPLLRVLNPSMPSSVLCLAYSNGFSWYYCFPQGSSHSLLTCLGLGLLFHDLMPSSDYLDWKNTVWRCAPAVSPVLDYAHSKVSPMNYSAFKSEEFWIRLEEVVREVAIRLCEENELPFLAEGIRNGEVVDSDRFEPALESLCKAMSVELHVYKLIGQEDLGLKCFNNDQDSIRCYVTVAEDDDTYHYLGHRDFCESKAKDAEGGFPFKTQAKVPSADPVVADVDVPPLRQSAEPEEKLISALLLYIQSSSQYLSEVPSEYAECMAACQDYAAYRDSIQLPPFDVQLPPLKIQRTGPHAVQDCLAFNHSDSYSDLNCGHHFHTSCIRANLNDAYCEQRKASQDLRFACPSCKVEITDDTLEQICVWLRAEVNNEKAKNRKFKQCSQCKYSRNAKLVIAHTVTHDVCAACLRSMICPICKECLSPSDQKLVSRCFE